jgi:hypothetical protein
LYAPSSRAAESDRANMLLDKGSRHSDDNFVQHVYDPGNDPQILARIGDAFHHATRMRSEIGKGHFPFMARHRTYPSRGAKRLAPDLAALLDFRAPKAAQGDSIRPISETYSMPYFPQRK